MNYITAVAFRKGHILMEADRVEKSIYFIKKGIVRAFAPLADQEITFWFGEEGETILSMKSYVENKKGYENIELLEDCDLYELKIDKLNELYFEDIHIANWGRKLAQYELLKIESRMISSQLLSARERYDELIVSSPSIVQRVALKHIASYLGITPVSLSRVRRLK
ncbi:MAG: Crp/Fnr family transcriptional regulator [Sphingobacterium sp.]